MQQNDIDKIQKCSKNILIYFIDTCKKLDINYILLAGSVLGAVRHQGFIPWDDDIDVGLLRADYDCFMNYLNKKNLEDTPFFMQSYFTDNNYGHGYSKLIIRESSIVESAIPNVLAKQGIFIDIFPLDYFPKKNNLKNMIKLKLLNIEIHTRLLYNTEVSFKKKVVHQVISMIFEKKTLNYLVNERDRIVKSKAKSSDFVVNLFTTYNLNKEVLNKSDIINPDIVSFEGVKVNIPRHWDKYLKSLYGNYMDLPPKDKRVNSHLKTYRISPDFYRGILDDK